MLQRRLPYFYKHDLSEKKARDQPSNGDVERRTDEEEGPKESAKKLRQELSCGLESKGRTLKFFSEHSFMSRQTIHNKSGKKKKTNQALFAFLRHVRIMPYPAAEPS
jgi:hypothetical protein